METPFTTKQPKLTEFNIVKQSGKTPIPKVILSPTEIKNKNSFYLNIFLLILFFVLFILFALYCKANTPLFKPSDVSTLDYSLFTKSV